MQPRRFCMEIKRPRSVQPRRLNNVREYSRIYRTMDRGTVPLLPHTVHFWRFEIMFCWLFDSLLCELLISFDYICNVERYLFKWTHGRRSRCAVLELKQKETMFMWLLNSVIKLVLEAQWLWSVVFLAFWNAKVGSLANFTFSSSLLLI